MSTHAVVDLFAGPGGWDLAAQRLGIDVVGIEFDAAACATRRAAGLSTVEADVLDIDPMTYVGIEGLIASPPCQTFSLAGKGAGREALDEVLHAVVALATNPTGEPFAGVDLDDVRTRLVVEPLRWTLLLRPTWIAWEQVPPVLPVWQACAEALARHGYHVATGVLHAEQYGVPQTRKRAVLVARLDREVSLPEPTHTRYRKGKPRRDEGLLPWVSMADALGWGMDPRPSMTVTGGGSCDGRCGAVRERCEDRHDARARGREVVVVSNYGTGGDPKARGRRRGDEPAASVTSKIDRNVVVTP